MFGGFERILSPDLKYNSFYFSKLDKFEKLAIFFLIQNYTPFQTPDFLPWW